MGTLDGNGELSDRLLTLQEPYPSFSIEEIREEVPNGLRPEIPPGSRGAV